MRLPPRMVSKKKKKKKKEVIRKPEREFVSKIGRNVDSLFLELKKKKGGKRIQYKV